MVGYSRHSPVIIADRAPSLLSFAKFLELLIYSPFLCTFPYKLCSHSDFTPPAPATSSITSARFNFVRHFAYSGQVISFVLSSVKDVFELRVPRLQILRAYASEKSSDDVSEEEPAPEIEDEKRILRREIVTWWEGVGRHIDKLVRLH